MSKPILTLTLNPSVDISYPLEHLNIDTVNRVSTARKTAGGKGLNVARVLSQLGQKTEASGFLGGDLGNYISRKLDEDGIKDRFMQISGETRNCIAILHDDGKQTEILESGPEITADEAAGFMNHLEQCLEDIDIMTISGSLPKGLPVDFYSKLIEIAEKKGVQTLLDTSGKPLLRSLSSLHRPYLIKPNQEEIGQIAGEKVEDMNQLKNILLENPMLSSIPWVVVSLGKNGAVAKVGMELYQAKIPVIDAVNPVGSGDSTVAGLACALNRRQNAEEVLKTAMTAGILNTLNKKTGCIDTSLFDHYYSQIEIEKMR
ncbi:hexose kinase [Ligilactobacillus sp.]|uniref:hexose kinase n=1 Tax=Ligilactobacillus sp. TaxID=2767921 RepID=UPI002FE2A0CE